MSLKVGILIVGSLLWRSQPYRVAWRQNRLKADEAVSVRVPIRYGRLSLSKTYTMVFAPDCPLGTGKAVPCHARVFDAAGLLTEATELWTAELRPATERNPQERTSASWGCVALLANPHSQIPATLTDEWAQHVSGERGKAGKSNYDPNSYRVSGRSFVSNRGLLEIPWPAMADTGMPLNGFDLLLATATKPNAAPSVPEFPTVAAIADGWNKKKEESEYFWLNRKNGIHTFEDDAILRLLTT